MKHRLSALLNGMEMTRSEHDWLEQRFDNMTAKEELLFRGAVGIEHPEALQDAIQILQSLEHYRLLYGADDDVTLGRFVMEHIHSPTPAARAYLDPETVGAAYRERGAGCYVGEHYVERLSPDRAISLEELGAELKNHNFPKIVVGDGALLCYNSLRDQICDLTLAPEHLRLQSAWGVARAAQELAARGELVKSGELVPVYHRLSQAERERLERERSATNGRGM